MATKYTYKTSKRAIELLDDYVSGKRPLKLSTVIYYCSCIKAYTSDPYLIDMYQDMLDTGFRRDDLMQFLERAEDVLSSPTILQLQEDETAPQTPPPQPKEDYAPRLDAIREMIESIKSQQLEDAKMLRKYLSGIYHALTDIREALK